MTLVIVKRSGNKVSIGSDSRVSFGDQARLDFGVKVYSVPVKIYSSTNAETNTNTLDYDYSIGVAVTGSLISGYTVKDIISEVLQNLQYAQSITTISMDRIADLIFNFYQKTAQSIVELLGESGLSEFIITGYCLEQDKIKVYKYNLEIIEGVYAPLFCEILENSGLEFFGSGKRAAKAYYDSSNDSNILKIIRSVIKDNTIEGVGGGLQYGEIANKTFEIFGVEDYVLDEDGRFGNYLYTLRGLSLYQGRFEMNHEHFHIGVRFIRPFEAEINELIYTID